MRTLFKILNIDALLICVFLSVGCSDSNVPENFVPSLSGHSLEISNNQLTFESQGGVENATVHADNVAWLFSGLPEWLTVSPSSGSTTTSVTFTAEVNNSADTRRTALFYLESADNTWNYRMAISANQAATSAYLTPAVNALSFQGSGGTQTIKVSSNVVWYAVSSATWVKATSTADGKSLTIEAEANPSDVSRKAIVTLSSEIGVNTSISITQDPAGVEGSTETLIFENDGGTKSVSITSEAEWQINTSDSWITVSPSFGTAGSHILAVTTLPNNSVGERSGSVFVVIGGSSRLKIPVVQRGLYIEVDQTTLSFSADAETKQIEIISNTNWYISSIPEWLTVNTRQGNNSQTISLKSQKNISSSKRSGRVIIGKEGISFSAVVDVLQEGINLSVDNNNLQFSDKASTQTININTIAEWSVSCSDKWISVSKNSGIGKTTLSISVEDNNNESSRTGSIMITAGDLSQLITVTQQGKYFTFNGGDKTFTSKGGTLQISFSTNEDWIITVSDNASWVALSKSSGAEDASIDITVKDNASMNARECSLYIQPSVSQGFILKIKQDGRYLTIDTEGVAFNADGGISDIVNVNTDGDFEVVSTDSWLKINNVSPTSFTIQATVNKGNLREGKVSVRMANLVDDETFERVISVKQEGSLLNGHEFVDLGLPSKTMWATRNLGAETRNSIGNLYCWGEPTPRTDFFNAYRNYDFSLPFSDAASKEWGASWCTPSKEQMEELVNNCTWSKAYSANGVFLGYYASGRNGNMIFFPEGCTSDRDKDFRFSRFWTQTKYGSYQAFHLSFSMSDSPTVTTQNCYDAAAIRPVFKK